MLTIKNEKGTITIFLSIILFVIVVIGGILVDGARIRIGEAQVTRAVNTAATSTLAGYHSGLKQEYGLFVLHENNSEVVTGIVEEYIHKNLMTELGTSNNLNLYDYRIDEIRVIPIFNLSENSVMRHQILEHMKFRAPKTLVEDFIGILDSFKQFGNQSKIMEKKVKIEKELLGLRKVQEDLYKDIEIMNQFNNKCAFEKTVDSYVKTIADKKSLEEQLLEATKDSEPSKKELKSYINQKEKDIRTIKKEMNNQLSSYQSYANDAKKTMNKLIKKWDKVQGKVKVTLGDLSETNQNIEKKVKREIKQYEKNLSENGLGNIKKLIEQNENHIEGIQEIIAISENMNVNGKQYKKIKSIVKQFKVIHYPIQVTTPDKKYKEENPIKVAKIAVDKEGLTKTNQEDIKDFPKEQLPSYRVKSIYPNKVDTKSYSEEDEDFVKRIVKSQKADTETLDAEKTAIGKKSLGVESSEIINGIGFSNGDFTEKSFSHISEITDIITDNLEAVRDEIYINEYILTVFNDTVSDMSNQTNRYFNKSEVEYILIGTGDEIWNTNIVKSEILLIRFGVNVLHLYQDPVKNNYALKIATSIAGWTGFGIPLLHTLTIGGWAMGESLLDLDVLMAGEKVPFYKTKKDWQLQPGGIKNAILNKMSNTAEEVTDRVAETVNDMIEEVIDEAVEQAFDQIYNGIDTGFELISDELSKQIETDEQNMLSGLKSKIFELAKEKAERLMKEPVENAEATINKKKEEMKSEINKEIDSYRVQVIKEIKSKLHEGQEALGEYLDDSIGNNESNEFMSSLTLFSYADYLKLFLLLTDSETKMNRVQDLIYLNMYSQDPTFVLSDYNTYLRIEVTVSIKYVFMTQTFLPKGVRTPEGDRHQFKVLLYRGY